MQNSVVINDGIIEIVEVGDQTKDTIEIISQEALRLSKDVDKILLLADLTRAGKADMGARLAAKKVADNLSFEKMAFVGANTFLASVIKLINKAAREERATKFFKTRGEALNWLKSSSQ